MYFNEIEIENYKCFKDKVSLKLEKGINVIIGKNSVGKTALLEALSLEFPNEPHRSIETFPKFSRPPESKSKVSATFTIERDELIDTLLISASRGNRDVNLPVDKEYWYEITSRIKDDIDVDKEIQNSKAKIFAKDYFSSENFTLKLQREALTEESHIWNVLDDTYINPILERSEENNGATQHYLKFQVEYPSRNFKFKETYQISGSGRERYSDDFSQHIGYNLSHYIFRFRADRLPSEPCGLGQSEKLISNCRNLAEVLNLLQVNAYQFSEFNKLVQQVLPNIFQVGVIPSYGKLGLEDENARLGHVAIWNTEKEVKHNHLAKTLEDVGSGIGQVIAILYVLFTTEEPQVILIDEPQSFLHPNALRKLIEVLRFYAEKYQHQIIIATHSPSVITVADPSTVTLLTQNGSVSNLQKIDIHQIDNQKIFLSEIGARFSDVFGYDRIIWVEGETEEECFPKIAGRLHPLLGTAILRVQNTGDFDAKNKDFVERIVSIYERLSKTNNGLVPTTVDFIFDKELRSTPEIIQLKKLGREMQNKECVHFTGKRMYENYLLNSEGIAEVINEIDKSKNNNVKVSEINKWIEKNKDKKDYYKNKQLPNPKDWKNEIHGKQFLKDLFSKFIQTEGLPYQETIHSVKLTDWLLKNAPDNLNDIAKLIEKIILK